MHGDPNNTKVLTNGLIPYANITGVFNENYASSTSYTGYTKYYHEGLDLRGSTGTDIHSLIHAEVLAYGWYGNYGKTIILRNLNGKGVYLLAHLSEYVANIHVEMKVGPGQVVGKVGGSGLDKDTSLPKDDRYDPHLHITYYDYESDDNTKDIFDPPDTTGKIGISNTQEHKKILETRRDPFDHTVVRNNHV